MFHHLKTIILLSIFTLSSSVAEECNYNSEINYLLAYVGKTQCMYIRNGTSYTGTEALAHITKKYNYFKDDIHSTEDFIRLSATESTVFGNTYYIKCKGKEKVKSANWLQKALEKYRKKK